jgi:hypothetical protein
MKGTAAQKEHYRAFNHTFFAKHQRKLLWLLNAKLTRRWFRRVLRIHRDCPGDVRIVELHPHAYVRFAGYVQVKGAWQEQRVADFRTHPKFGKRLYFAFKPLWWALHAWDSVFADRMAPALSFGFSTLTVFPDAGTGATTVDGIVYRSGVDEAFSTIKAGAGSAASASDAVTNAIFLHASATSNQYDELHRTILTFDTSLLTALAVISAAVMSVYVFNKDDAIAGTPSLALVGSTPAANNTLAASDYGNVGTTEYASRITYGSITASAYNNFTENATGRANVSLTSITKRGLREGKYDISAGTPPWSSGNRYSVNIQFADTSGTSQDPKLVVTYTFAQTFTQTITAADSIIRTTGKNLLETITHSEVFAYLKLSVLTLTEGISAADTFIRSVTRLFSETLTTSDALVRTIARLYSETVSTIVAFLAVTGRSFSETVSVVDSIVRSTSHLLTDAISNTATMVRTTSREYIEAVSITAVFQRVLAKVLTEGFVILDSIVKRLNGLITIYLSKFTSRGTSHNSKYTDRGTTHTTKFE